MATKSGKIRQRDEETGSHWGVSEVMVDPKSPVSNAGSNFLDLGYPHDLGKPPLNSISGWWFGTLFFLFHTWDVILPIDELICFKMVIAPPTRHIYIYIYILYIYIKWIIIPFHSIEIPLKSH